MTLKPIRFPEDGPRDFYTKYVERSFNDYLKAKHNHNKDDILYYGTIACSLAHSMAEHVRNHLQIVIKNPTHLLPNSDVSITVTQNYIADLKKYWPAFKLNSLVAESVRHKKSMKLEKRKEWIGGTFNPEVSLGSVCIASDGGGSYDLILPENQNISESLLELLHGWDFILKQI